MVTQHILTGFSYDSAFPGSLKFSHVKLARQGKITFDSFLDSGMDASLGETLEISLSPFCDPWS